MFPVASPVFSCCSAGGGHKSSARSKRPDQRVRVVEMFQENPEENMRKHQKTCKMSMFHDVPLALSQMSAKGQLCYGDLDTICPTQRDFIILAPKLFGKEANMGAFFNKSWAKWSPETMDASLGNLCQTAKSWQKSHPRNRSDLQWAIPNGFGMGKISALGALSP